MSELIYKRVTNPKIAYVTYCFAIGKYSATIEWE